MIFEDGDDRALFYGLLATAVSEHEVECHQDVQMGNHVHLLLGGEIAAVSEVMWFVCQRYAVAYNARYGRSNHLLGRRFHSSEVPDPAAARAVCIYIAMNPVRGGLCRHPGEWEYGSYAAAVGLTAPRPHVSANFTDALFAGRRTSFAQAVEAALVLDRGGRPRLGDILPSPEQLTDQHVRHAREVYGFTLDEIAEHYDRTARTLHRWLAA
jgi:REP element-mobilizing transposase RayT